MSVLIKKKWCLALLIRLLMGMMISILLTACFDNNEHAHPELTSGKDFYNHHCAICHTEIGIGKLADTTPDETIVLKSHKDANAPAGDVPTNVLVLQDREEIIVSAGDVPPNVLNLRSREDIINYITAHVDIERRMPMFGTMPRSEAIAIADHLLELRRINQSMPEGTKQVQPLPVEP